MNPTVKPTNKWKLYGSLIAVLAVQSGVSLTYNLAQQDQRVHVQTFASESETAVVRSTKTKITVNGKKLDVTLRSIEGSKSTQITVDNTEAAGVCEVCVTGKSVGVELKEDNSTIGEIIEDAKNILEKALKDQKQTDGAKLASKDDIKSKVEEYDKECKEEDRRDRAACRVDKLLEISEELDDSEESIAIVELYFEKYVKAQIKGGQGNFFAAADMQDANFINYNNSTSLAGQVLAGLNPDNGEGVAKKIVQMLRRGFSDRQLEGQAMYIREKNSYDMAKSSGNETLANLAKMRMDQIAMTLTSAPTQLFGFQSSMLNNSTGLLDMEDRMAFNLMRAKEFTQQVQPFAERMLATKDWSAVIPELAGEQQLFIATTNPLTGQQTLSPINVGTGVRARNNYNFATPIAQPEGRVIIIGNPSSSATLNR